MIIISARNAAVQFSPPDEMMDVEAYERLLAAQEAQLNWRELVSAARERVRVDLAGARLPAPETMLGEMREARDEQLSDLH